MDGRPVFVDVLCAAHDMHAGQLGQRLARKKSVDARLGLLGGNRSVISFMHAMRPGVKTTVQSGRIAASSAAMPVSSKSSRRALASRSTLLSNMSLGSGVPAGK